MKTRLWWFTNFKLDFNYQALYDGGGITCICYGNEECPTTNRPHHQGFIHFINPRESEKQVAKMLGKCKVGACCGSLADNERYCSKESSLTVIGVLPEQGARTDLVAIKNEIANGRTVEDIAMSSPHIYHQYGRTLTKIEDIVLRKKFRTWTTTCEWIYGTTGSGKSAYAFKDFNPETHYRFPDDNGWWDGYTGQSIVIFDEFRGCKIKYSELLTFIDKYPHVVRRRNREPAPFLATHVIITSCFTPEQAYSGLINDTDSITQLLRRILVFKCENDILEQRCS